MVKKIIFIFILSNSILNASVYEKNCLACHNKLPISIDKYFYRYLLKYSSQKNVMDTMFTYLKNPQKDKTIMPEAFITRFGIKNSTTLNDQDLKKALDEYWEIYKVFGKLE